MNEVVIGAVEVQFVVDDAGELLPPLRESRAHGVVALKGEGAVVQDEAYVRCHQGDVRVDVQGLDDPQHLGEPGESLVAELVDAHLVEGHERLPFCRAGMGRVS
ncbi:hypothetical protein ACFZAU_41260 [Streptomyces sp. NPDC008238]